ncbi:MAG TPA: DUF2231 domain-containing protein [Candidatus Sulfotelmatobacter sp.]|nr:DUF2231 domain-containing protein [Candidatus Sulfotelmatobacter sp.]
MLQFPVIPSWDALHPLIIHFPIALLLVAPIFIVVGAVLTPTKGRAYLIAAMVLLLVGTGSIFLAVETGEAAGKLAERTPGMEQILETHQSLAERTQAVFSVLSVIFLALLAVPWLLNRADTRLTITILPLAFLILYSAGALLLVNTAHNGGRLVHEFGVRAMVTSAPVDANATPPMQTEQDKD